ncbi:MAG: hypothetical protein AMXMBFR13_31900 [Phycisphaerae bacterium]
MSVTRYPENPLIRPADVQPSRPDFQVVCVFNAGVTRVGDEIILLLRVAERPPVAPDEAVAPILDPDDVSRGIHLMKIKRDDPDFAQSDPRAFGYKGRPYLTSISHLRIARSRDGRNFAVDERPAMCPQRREEEFGIEDPRITRIKDEWFINYSAISRYGISTSLATTYDFNRFERHGVIFCPENRDVTIFPEQVNGRYVAFHRPVPRMIGDPDIWLASSPDLLHWGEHRYVCGARRGMWDGWRIGGGAVPFKTPRGWLEIYHGADQSQRYALGVLLTELDAPHKVIARSKQPILAPEAQYEKEGFFGNVVFTCGALAEPDGRVIIYYGAADECIAAAETSVDDLLATVI